MAGWYVRRGEKVVGPVDPAKLKELAATGKVLPTDQLAKDAAGPWTEAGRTTLFAKKPAAAPAAPKPEPQPAHIAEPRPAPLVPTVERVPVEDRPGKGTTVVRGSLVAITTVGRGALATTSVVFRSLSTWSQRRHELKLAKIQAKAAVDAADGQRAANRVAAAPAAAPPAQTITFAPQMIQSTVVKVYNKNPRGCGCGCSGCGTILLIIIAVIAGLAIFSNPSPQTHPPIHTAPPMQAPIQPPVEQPEQREVETP